MKNKKVKIVAAITLILALLFGGILIYNRFFRGDLIEDEVKAKLGQLSNKTEEEITAALDEIVDENSLRISICTNPVFPSGESEGNLEIENHPNNHYNIRVYINGDIDGDGEDETVYHSGIMPLNPDGARENKGSHIDSDKLDIELSRGEYEVMATFNAYDTQTDELVGSVNVPMTITVLS